ncbi:hypothetical protein BT69DRAFT_1291708 [Atractiella rhizophila]|nr:hypothetical protein BT69DRAFT_1291708 [Atractiella rhizophila]
MSRTAHIVEGTERRAADVKEYSRLRSFSQAGQVGWLIKNTKSEFLYVLDACPMHYFSIISMVPSKTTCQIKLVDMAKRNSEEGMAISTYLHYRNSAIPSYDELQVLKSVVTTMRQDRNYTSSCLYKMCEELKKQLSSKEEDNDCPFHHAFSGYCLQSSSNSGFRHGLKSLKLLWDGLCEIENKYNVLSYLVQAQKASLCVAAVHFHQLLVTDLVVDEAGDDGGLFALSSGEKNEMEVSDSGEDCEQVEQDEMEASNWELADMLLGKIFKKSKKRIQISKDEVPKQIKRGHQKGTNTTSASTAISSAE